MTKAYFQPQVILGVAAHPDDLEFGIGGSVAKWTAKGTNAYYLILTDGSKGTSDRNLPSKKLTAMRQEEQRAAAKLLGVTDVFFLGYEDGLLENTSAVKCDIARKIRELKPDTVLTMDPSVLYVAERGMINHPDHREAGQATLDAVYPLARDHLSFPELLEDGLQPHIVTTVLLVGFGKANFYVDITDSFDQKIAAMCAHASQFGDPTKAAKMLHEWASKAGKSAGCKYAEGFIRINLT